MSSPNPSRNSCVADPSAPSPDFRELFLLEKSSLVIYLRKWCQVLHNLRIRIRRRQPDIGAAASTGVPPAPSICPLSLSLLCSRGVIALLPSLHRPPLHPSSNQRDIHVKKSQFIIFGRIRAKISGGNVRLVCFKGIQFGYMYSFFFYIQVSQIILVHRMLYY